MEVFRGLGSIEAELLPTFMSAPKNAWGRVAPLAARHVLRTYFVKEHGWQFRGFESSFSSKDLVGAPRMLLEQVPALSVALLEERQGGKGLSLSELVAVAAALEQIILNQAVEDASSAYYLAGLDQTQLLTEEESEKVLLAYLMVANQHVDPATSTPGSYQKWLATKHRGTASYEAKLTMVRDAVRNFEFKHRNSLSPFGHALSFETMARIASHMVDDIEKITIRGNCQNLHDTLLSHDPTRSGRVPFSAFHSIGKVGPFVLSESQEELRSLGVLDESVRGEPRVRSVNYLVHPGNCNPTFQTSFMSGCCRTACDLIMTDLEDELRSPTVSPESLLKAIENVSSLHEDLDDWVSTLQGPRGKSLSERLQSIAKRNDGAVPLHGRLFAQWLHFAFPTECPHPVSDVCKSVGANSTSSTDAETPMWCEEEHLYLVESESEAASSDQSGPQRRQIFSFIALLAAGCAMFRWGLETVQVELARHSSSGLHNFKREKGASLLPCTERPKSC